MFCKDCKWFESGYLSSDRGICQAKCTYEYPNHYCHLASAEIRQYNSWAYVPYAPADEAKYYQTTIDDDWDDVNYFER